MTRIAFGDLHTLNFKNVKLNSDKAEAMDLAENYTYPAASRLKPIAPGRILLQNSEVVALGCYKRGSIWVNSEDNFIRIAVKPNAKYKDKNMDDIVEESLKEIQKKFPKAVYSRFAGPFYGNFWRPDPYIPPYDNVRALPIPFHPKAFDPNAQKLALHKIEFYDSITGQFEAETLKFNAIKVFPLTEDERQFKALGIVCRPDYKPNPNDDRWPASLKPDYENFFTQYKPGSIFYEYFKTDRPEYRGRSAVKYHTQKKK